MPRLPALAPAEIIRVLEQRGFVFDRAKGSHRIYVHPDSKRRAVVPFHRHDLPKGACLEILRQAGISKEELAELL